MIRSLLSKFALLFCLSFIMIFTESYAQQTVFTETFNAPGTPQNSAFTTSGQIGTSNWTVTRSGNDFGAKIDQGFLTLTNDVGSIGNVKGWVLASTSTSNFLPAYNPILSQNPGIVSWNFNMRQLRTNPSGLTDGKFGVAYVLAGTSGSTGITGKGYAIMLGQSGTKDAIRLVTYNNGIQTYYTKLSSSTSGLKDFGKEYSSIRVEYNPLNNEWSMFLRKDNSNLFIDPKSGTLVSQGKITNSEFVGETLTMTGAYWNAATTTKQTAFFDNISVSVVTPEIISINPDSKIANSGAFNLVVAGKGFTNASKVYWNGLLRTTTYNSTTQLTASIPATDIPAPGMVPITVRNGSFVSNTVDFEIESSGVPVLTLSKTVLPFISTVQATASAATETYTITGSNLTASAILTAPVNFEISRDGTTYFNSIELAITGGALTDGTDGTVTLRARLKSTAQAGNYTGNITHTTTGALTTKVVGLMGRVIATEPTTNASAVSFTNITSTGFKLNWTNSGNGEQRLVLIKQATAVNGVPLDATTYNANAAFAIGTLIGADNYVVYKGSGNFVQITGLEPNKQYHISIIEFNGIPGTENYRDAGVVGSATTLNSPAGLQVKLINTSYKIDFDNTVDGVNLDTFQGSGISKIAEAGQLDSDSWAFTGFSGGTINFGGESLEDSSYENGTSDGDEVDSGIYAFNVGSATDENYTLGIHPGGTDFNPGTITLRIQNQTGVPATSFNIGYKVYVSNDEDSSTKIGFSYLPTASTDGSGTYTPINSLDVTSQTTADLVQGWKAYYRVATVVPPTAIANNAYCYIRWSGSSASGTAAQDEFAIDDIEVIANPVAPNTVSFDGVAEDFVLQGNASLSNDLSVRNRLLFNGGKLAIKDKMLTIAGSVINTTANGLTGGATSKLVVRGIQNPSLSFDQTVGANVFESFSLIGANPNTVTALNNFSVNGNLNVEEQQILNLGTVSLLGSLTSIQNNGIIRTQNTSATPFPANKIWNGIGILNLDATSAAQTLVAGTYNNLTLSSTGGTTAVANVAVNGTLDLPAPNASATKGSLSMGTFTLTMGENGTNTGIGDVTGITKRDAFVANKMYTFGHPNSSITFTPAGTLPSTMSAKLIIGVAPTWKTGTILRQYDIIQTGAVDTKAIIRQHYLDSELNGNVESKLAFWAHTTSPVSSFDQGRSNSNTSDNWVVISNANIGLYFKSIFDQVYITLDETSGADLVWNGSISTSWNTSANWTPAGVPSASTKVFIPNASTTSNRSPIIDATSSVKTITIDAGGIVNTPDNSILNVSEGAGAWQNTGTFNPGNGTVVFNNLDATISGSTTFNNVTITVGAGLRALEGNYMSIAGTFTNNGTMFTTLLPNTIEFKGTNQIIPAPGGESFGGYHNLIVNGSGATIASTILNVRGNLTLNQAVPFTGKTINLAGISDQKIAGTAAINFDNVVVNKETGAVILEKDIAVVGTLTLTSGNIIIGNKNLTLGSNPVLGTFNSHNMIVADGTGLVRRPFTGIGSYEFPIGEETGAASYSPVTVNVTAGTFANAFVGVNVSNLKHPNNNSSQNYLKKYWNVTQTGITGAVATVTAKYEPLDILGSESEIATAQLNGTFNLPSNPWIKSDPLSNNTLMATNAVLTSGQTSVFTGLKAGDFTLEVYGYGDFCIGSTQTMNAVISGGNAPFTYIWSNGLENAEVVTIPTITVGEIFYTLTVYDANGFSATDANIPVYIAPLSIGGTISNASQQICANSLPADLQLTGSIGAILHWQKSADINFTANTESNPNNVTNISNFTTSLTGAEIGSIGTTTYIRAVLQNGDCEESLSTVATITVKSTTWDGSVWSAGEPDSSTSAIFEANYTATTNINACNVVVANGAAVSVPTGLTFTVSGSVNVVSGSLTLENNANLIQIADVENNGTITVKRNSSALKRLDYTLWSSPVNNQQLFAFSPQTTSNRFYSYNSDTNIYNSIQSPSINTFNRAEGYLIRMPNNHPATTPTIWNGTFTGVPHNGTITVPMQNFGANKQFNLVGNPYPSPIDAKLFVQNPNNAANITGTLYFWRKTNDATQPSYYTWTTAGLVAPTTTDQTIVANNNGIIQTAQGFFVEAKDNAENFVFTNAMRKDDHANQFFKAANTATEYNRVWLNATNAEGWFSQTLIGYFTEGSDDLDSSDGKYINDGDIAFSSLIGNVPYAIQGKALPFNSADIVPMYLKVKNAGNYTIAIDHVDGLFSENQDIFLRDTQTGIEHDLKSGGYTFASEAGIFAERFLVIYQNALSVKNPAFDSNSVVLYKKESSIVINSGSATLDHVEVFDVRGRLLAFAKNINANEISIKVGETNQVLIVKITSTDGVSITKRTIN